MAIVNLWSMSQWPIPLRFRRLKLAIRWEWERRFCLRNRRSSDWARLLIVKKIWVMRIISIWGRKGIRRAMRWLLIVSIMAMCAVHLKPCSTFQVRRRFVWRRGGDKMVNLTRFSKIIQSTMSPLILRTPSWRPYSSEFPTCPYLGLN